MPLPPVGSLYIKNWNGIAFSQPLGVGTAVVPSLGDGDSFGYPVPNLTLQPSSQALWISPCSHGFDTVEIFRDWDPVTQMSAAVCCCPVCTYILRYIEPYESIQNPIQFPIIIP